MTAGQDGGATLGGADPRSAGAGAVDEIVAVATRDPLHPDTFSGYSRRLFTGVTEQGVRVVPIRTRDLRWHDLVTGAVSPGAVLPGRRRSRSHPTIRPDWYWSRRGFDRMSDRFAERLLELPAGQVVVQVGTHVTARTPGTRVIRTESPYVLFVGADWEQKGGPLLLEAFRLARARVPALRLVVGCRPAAAEHIGSHFTWPQVSRDLLQEISR
ncbi:MAG: hypothetical protein ACYC1Z_05540 [Georgenia sp.]